MSPCLRAVVPSRYDDGKWIKPAAPDLEQRALFVYIGLLWRAERRSNAAALQEVQLRNVTWLYRAIP